MTSAHRRGVGRAHAIPAVGDAGVQHHDGGLRGADDLTGQWCPGELLEEIDRSGKHGAIVGDNRCS